METIETILDFMVDWYNSYSTSSYDEHREYVKKTLKGREVKKAFSLRMSDIEEMYLYNYEDFIVYSDNSSSAKKELWGEIQKHYLIHRKTMEELRYIDIRVHRVEEYDKYLIFGDWYSIIEINSKSIAYERENQLNKILGDDNIKYCRIIKNGLYYRPNSNGYTSNIFESGIYCKIDAVRKAKNCDALRIIPIIDEEIVNQTTNKISELLGVLDMFGVKHINEIKNLLNTKS